MTFAYCGSLASVHSHKPASTSRVSAASSTPLLMIFSGPFRPQPTCSEDSLWRFTTLCRFFQVEHGCGIGFVASVEISASVYLAVVETAYILKQEVMQARRTTAYSRYRDDTFITAKGGNGNLGTLSGHWKCVANQNKSPYLLEGWVVSSDSGDFLDTELYTRTEMEDIIRLFT